MTRNRVLGALGLVLFSGGLLVGQGDIQPVTSAPNPYTTVSRWGALPAGRAWGAASAAHVDSD
jgi:hypothetical protein